MPEYPAQLQLEGVEGEVRLEVMIDEQGAVTILSVISATHNEFVQPARQAVSRWRFEPPTRDGVPVRARYVQPIPFRLQ
ncbi:MAG: energy transducer TonB [Puniceicoccaceae bacterium]|nr:MAG: energy transducer TonB [Puniceicoccaceae bacterium]